MKPKPNVRLNRDQDRNYYANEWREPRKAIRHAHSMGHYGAASALRVYLNLVERCFR